MALLALASCGRPQEQRPAWRAEAEQQCLRSGQLRLSPSIRQMPPLNPGGYCGADYPLRVEGFDRLNIRMSRGVAMNCQMAVATERWLAEVVQPAAMREFGSPVTQVDTYGTYSCRRINNSRRGSMSEHSFANAIDVSGFRLADGRRVQVGRPMRNPLLPSPWRFQEERSLGVALEDGGLDLLSIGPGIDGAQPPDINFGASDAQGFWRAARNGACDGFATVLGPGSDAAHADHLHLDLARRLPRSGQRRSVCR